MCSRGSPTSAPHRRSRPHSTSFRNAHHRYAHPYLRHRPTTHHAKNSSPKPHDPSSQLSPHGRSKTAPPALFFLASLWETKSLRQHATPASPYLPGHTFHPRISELFFLKRRATHRRAISRVSHPRDSSSRACCPVPPSPSKTHLHTNAATQRSAPPTPAPACKRARVFRAVCGVSGSVGDGEQPCCSPGIIGRG